MVDALRLESLSVRLEDSKLVQLRHDSHSWSCRRDFAHWVTWERSFEECIGEMGPGEMCHFFQFQVDDLKGAVNNTETHAPTGGCQGHNFERPYDLFQCNEWHRMSLGFRRLHGQLFVVARSCTVHGKVREHTRDCHLVFVPNSERQYQKEVLFPQSSLESFPI